jgi:hypothetical protein
MFKYMGGPTVTKMILFDYLRDFYDYILPFCYPLGAAFIGISITSLVLYIWYAHGTNAIITYFLAALLIIGGLMYNAGKNYNGGSSNNEAERDAAPFS